MLAIFREGTTQTACVMLDRLTRPPVEDSDASLDASLTLSQARDHSGRNDAKIYARPMPANARAILIDALREAHRWLDVLLSDPHELKADYGMATSVSK